MRCRDSEGRSVPCVFCHLGEKGRSFFRGHYGYRVSSFQNWEDDAMTRLRRGDSSGKPKPAEDRVDPACRKRFPLLLEQIEAATFEDGAARQPCTLTFFASDGSIKACLSDRETEETAWITAVSFQAVLEGLERGLEKESLDWRRKPATYGKGKRG